MNENNFRHFYGIFFKSTILNLLDHMSEFIRNNFETLWQRYLEDTLQLKILRTWINVGTNYSLSKFLETKIDESAWKIIYRIFRACSSKNISLRHFTYYYLLFLTFDVPCVLELIQSFHVFYNCQWNFDKVQCCLFLEVLNEYYYVFIFYETFVPVNGENYFRSY